MGTKVVRGPGRYSKRGDKCPKTGQKRKWKRRNGIPAKAGIKESGKKAASDDEFDLDAFMERMRRGEIV